MKGIVPIQLYPYQNNFISKELSWKKKSSHSIKTHIFH